MRQNVGNNTKINGKGDRKSKQGSSLILMVIITDGYFWANKHRHTSETEITIVPSSKWSLSLVCGLQKLSKIQHIEEKLLTSTRRTYLAWHYMLGTARKFGRIQQADHTARWHPQLFMPKAGWSKAAIFACSHARHTQLVGLSSKTTAGISLANKDL